VNSDIKIYGLISEVSKNITNEISENHHFQIPLSFYVLSPENC